MKISLVKNTIEKALELIGNINVSELSKRNANQDKINKAYDILFDLRKHFNQVHYQEYHQFFQTLN